MTTEQLTETLTACNVSKSALQQAMRICCYITYREIATLTHSAQRIAWMRVNNPSLAKVRAFEDRRGYDANLRSSESDRAVVLARMIHSSEDFAPAGVLLASAVMHNPCELSPRSPFYTAL